MVNTTNVRQDQIKISVVIPVYNAVSTLDRCLEGVISSNYDNYELIVVDDGSTDRSRDLAKGYTDLVLESTTKQLGPAQARNRGAEMAKGEILFFIDADVVIKPDSLSKVEQTFNEHPEYDASFGSYDENPGSGDFLSQYKNLFHHFVHQQSAEEGDTFWSGCGAIRRDVFLEMGGFDVERYPRPSIEDIELGYRLRAAGHKIFVNKGLQVKHLKRWTFTGLLRTDIVDRAIPWSLLIMRERNLPNDLNLKTSQRLSSLLVVILILYMSFIAIVNQVWLLPLFISLAVILLVSWQGNQGSRLLNMDRRIVSLSYILILSIIALSYFQDIPLMIIPMVILGLILLIARMMPHENGAWRLIIGTLMMLSFVIGFGILLNNYSIWYIAPVFIIILLILSLNFKFYEFFVKKRGVSFALAAIPFHFLYYLYSLIAFVIGGGIHFWNNTMKFRPAIGFK
jgi:glycosyltransferase involved in cell wall biosynthesis